MNQVTVVLFFIVISWIQDYALISFVHSECVVFG